ncbi:sugar ABC transporter ATP-binding protein [Nonomuraea sp. NPDC049750]|uniref:sugar ABC transporter ATP-binding protein n=1 Tax=Nonomuraea sp. NPDC049750 TaxID=3154738 RepID=UPI0033FCCD93
MTVLAGPASRTASEPLIRIRGVGKRFGGTTALEGVDLDLHHGGILALLGQNGAGKSTLIKILAGVYRADEGEIEVAGHPLGSQAASRGMSFVHQDLGLVEWMSVAENIALGTGYRRRGGLISWRGVRERCVAALRSVAIRLDPDERIAGLTRAERSLVAIARALAAETEIIVLDEPTASLSAPDRARLFDALRALRDRGHGIVYVSHRLDEVREIADRVAVLRNGRLVSQGTLTGGDSTTLVRDIVGREPTTHRRPNRDLGEVVLSLTGVRTGQAGPISLDLRAGEAIGLVGLTGAGHVDLGRALAGAHPILAGHMLLDGRPYGPRSVSAAVDAGVGLVTSDRQEEGAAPSLSVRENFLANPRAHGRSPLSWIRPRAERAEAAALVACFGVQPADAEAPLSTLSGGNQQKVMIGRWLGTNRHVLILEEPTASVDVGAKPEIYRLLDEALAGGLAAILVSTDFEEVVNVCDRALMFVRGTVTTEVAGAALTVTALTHAASAAPAVTGANPR